ncbi:MAG: putative toxin-antitoxin system toxin component, PIN family [Pseudomonadota bacterium]|nr:MAG: putative toxin-antitoxin system toxin component, PIN family [Pseudomonadota bacterium]
MRVFIDSNIWISAFASRGFCADLLEWLLKKGSPHSLWISREVIEEVTRVLEQQFSLSDAGRQRLDRLLAVPNRSCGGEWIAPPDFPDPDDIAIVAAALAARAGLFITGDQALLNLETIDGMHFVSSREGYRQLRGL